MAITNMKYCEYFEVNEEYFPCIDESAINKGAKWDTTYPHEAFINLLNTTEKMLGGITNRSIWIHGAYGTGKSQCAFALKRILEATEEEVREYWNKYDNLKKNPILLEKLLGHKEQGILTAYRYASGSITIPQQLFFAVQESVKKALDAHEIPYKGENSLKESVISWLEDSAHNAFVDELLKRPRWMSTFSQSSANEIINALKKGTDVSALMNNIFNLAAVEGITALDLSADSLRSWILDVIQKNHIKIVLIWDEFSDFFRQNKNSLGEFQKIVSICQEAPFYFIVVTHPITSISSSDDSWKIVQQRFEKVEITLPDNIAFDLIGHAFNVKKAALANWTAMADDLNSSVNSSRRAVIRATGIKDDKVMRDILPIHPIAALVLKNIASAFQSNQRSMFDFIKTPKDMDVKAFQWFIQNTNPLDDRPLLTVDMLWDFFYEKGKDYLSSDIKLILDTFPQQTQLMEKEKIVLKTILIMQSIDQRLGGSLPILKPTDQNLSYAFEGDLPEYENSCKSIAKALVDKGVLILTPIGDGKKVYSAAVLAGDGAKIEGYKKDIREKGTTIKLVSEGPAIATALSLSPALKLRYAVDIETGKLPVVTISDFLKTMDALKNKDINWHFYAVLALAKTDDEAQTFRVLIKKTIQDESYKNIVVIDALSTPLGLDDFEKYIDFSAMAQYYNGNNNQQSKENNKKAKEVLERDWKDRIHDGSFIVYTYKNPDGEKATGASAVQSIMQTIVLNRYRYVQDFTRNLTETQLKLTTPKQVARYGIGGLEIKGLIVGCEKNVLGKFWNKKAYWEDEALTGEAIVIIKKAIDKLISDAFKSTGKISVAELYDCLEETFGFSPCNLSVFITGFILKEYSTDPYRSMDSEGHREPMTPDRLAEMLANYIGKDKPKVSYIVSLTPEEKAFYELTEAAWGIDANYCTSPNQAGYFVLQKMRELAFPIWCLEDVDTHGVYDLIKRYIKLVQSKGDDAHDIANDIGRIAIQRPTSAQTLKELLTQDNCKEGMSSFLQRFENGRVLSVSKEIGASDTVISDIKKLFSVEYSSLWNESTGEDEIRKLLVEYEFIKNTNILLNVSASYKDAALKAWRDQLKFVGFSCELIRAKRSMLDRFFCNLLKVAKNEDLRPDSIKALVDEMSAHSTDIRIVLDNPIGIFRELYSVYLEGLTDVDCEEVKNSITADLFTSTATQSNAIVKKAAEDFKKNQIKTQLFGLWNEKTDGTKNPRSWSEKYRTPILCCIPRKEYGRAKRVFAVMNNSVQSEAEIKEALEYVESTTIFNDIRQNDYRNSCFMRHVVGKYSELLKDVEHIRDILESTHLNAYEWSDSPEVKAKLKSLAEAEYNAGGSDTAVKIIENMSDTELRKWLIDFVRKDMGFGIEIIANGGK